MGGVEQLSLPGGRRGVSRARAVRKGDGRVFAHDRPGARHGGCGGIDDWRIYFDFAARYALPRPATPAYPAMSAAFEKAMADLRAGKDAAEAMDEAVETIEHDIARNDGYGFIRHKSVASK
jgi:hypothetical protein